LFVPNSFTPNNDGVNDVWFPVFDQLDEIQISIFNRWGEKVFESIELEKGWDGTFAGKICPEDTYIYLIKAEDMDGNQNFFFRKVLRLLIKIF
jgi:gliding motility-associated-like protein